VSAGQVADATTVLQPAVRFGTALEPAALADVAAPDFAGALRAAYGAALGLPAEAVLVAGLFNVRTGDTTTFLSTDDVNVAGNSEDAAAVLDGLLGGSSGRRRRARALQAAPATPNALNIVGLAPRRNASSAAVAVFFNALAPCPPPCSDAQNTAAANALRTRVLATASNSSLLAGVLPPGVGWALNAAAVIPYAMPRVKIRWRLWAWLASLPLDAVVGGAVGGFAALCLAAALWRRRRLRAKKAKVAPFGEASELAEEAPVARSGSGALQRPMRAWETAEVSGEEAEAGERKTVVRTAPLSRSTAPLSRSSVAWGDGSRAQLAPAARVVPPRPRAAPLQQPMPRWAASPQRAAGAALLRGMPSSPPPRALPVAGRQSVNRFVARAAAERAAAQAPDDDFEQQEDEEAEEEDGRPDAAGAALAGYSASRSRAARAKATAEEEVEKVEEEEEEWAAAEEAAAQKNRSFERRAQLQRTRFSGAAYSGANHLNVKQLDALRQRTQQTAKAKAAAAAKRQQLLLQSGRSGASTNTE
jgi:hypothetical protein